MRRRITWAVAALVVVAAPAVIGLVLVGGDDQARSKAALVNEGGGGAAYQLVVNGLPMPANQAIQVLHYSWGVTNPGGAPTTGSGAGKAQFGNLEITKKIDETSPLLVKGVVTGNPYPTAELKLYAIGKVSGPYATYTLKNVYIVSVQHNGAADDVPSEHVSFDYTSLTLDTASVSETGELEGSNRFGWDIANYAEIKD